MSSNRAENITIKTTQNNKKLPTQKYTEEKFNERKNEGGNLLDPLRKERKSANKSTIYIKVNNKD